MDKFISKQIEVEAIQYPNGDWKVVHADKNVENLPDLAFKSRFMPKADPKLVAEKAEPKAK